MSKNACLFFVPAVWSYNFNLDLGCWGFSVRRVGRGNIFIVTMDNNKKLMWEAFYLYEFCNLNSGYLEDIGAVSLGFYFNNIFFFCYNDFLEFLNTLFVVQLVRVSLLLVLIFVDFLNFYLQSLLNFNKKCINF